jgi:uncharacterized protein (TIGR03437 family)
MRALRLALWVPMFCGVIQAQLPAIYPHGVVNAASFMAPGLPAGAIALGSIFTILGAHFGPATPATATFPIQNVLSGVSVTASQGSTTVNVLPLYVSQGQINAVMPSNTPLGWVSVRVTYNNAKSNPAPVYVSHDSPGLITTGYGTGAAVVKNVSSAGDRSVNTVQNAAKPGQIVEMYATGLGPITAPDNQAPPANTPTTPVEVWVGGIAATVTYSGRSPCCSGLDQIDFVVPADAPQGCWTPILTRTSKANLSNGASMAIAANGGVCSSPENPFTSALVKGGAIGELWLMRTAIHQDVGVNKPIDLTGDTLDVLIRKQPGGPFVAPPMLAAPPPGTCQVYQGSGNYWSTGKLADATAFTTLDPGTNFTVAGGGASQAVTLAYGTFPLGSQAPLWNLPTTLFLNPGNYMVSSSGGKDVGAVKIPITVPSPVTWNNRDQVTGVDRSMPLTLNWSGGPKGQTIEIFGENSDLRTNSSAVFYCVAAAGSTSFTVPPQVLGFIPPTRPNPLDSTGIIFLISSSSSPFAAQGLAIGLASATYQSGKTVVFQ